MHKPTAAVTANWQSPEGTPAVNGDGLSALTRLAQIAEELRRAAERNDLEVVMDAAALLGPTLTRCEHLYGVNAEAAGIASEIQSVLLECEIVLTASMKDVGSDMKRLRNGKRALAMARTQCRHQAPARNLA